MDKRVQAMISLNNEGELWAAERLTLKPQQVHRIRVNLKKCDQPSLHTGFIMPVE